jgi:hypothetical protein
MVLTPSSLHPINAAAEQMGRSVKLEGRKPPVVLGAVAALPVRLNRYPPARPVLTPTVILVRSRVARPRGSAISEAGFAPMAQSVRTRRRDVAVMARVVALAGVYQPQEPEILHKSIK